MIAFDFSGTWNLFENIYVTMATDIAYYLFIPIDGTGILNMAASMSAKVRAVSSKTFIPRKAALVLTQSAVKRIKELLEKKPDAQALKIGVKQRGCNGLSYTLDYAVEKAKFDEKVEQDGVKIFIDSKAQLTLLGTQMDYTETRLSSEFIFNNPNIKGTCGCGESFSV